MNTIFKTLILLITIGISLQSCSSDDSNSNNNLDQRYAKKWYIGPQYFDIGQNLTCENNYYHLKTNGDLEYRIWSGESNCDFEIENGVWYIENNVLYRDFLDITLSDEIISVSETELVLKDPSDNSERTYFNYN